MNMSTQRQAMILFAVGLLIAAFGIWLFVYSPIGSTNPMSLGYAAAAALMFAGVAGIAPVSVDISLELFRGKYPDGAIPTRRVVVLLAMSLYVVAAILIAALQAAANAISS
ncbi:MAG: hypothetical protein KF790_09135 [Steroidobacteraceae bacterium]|nr:hypothetical protein [Steroidobacteraceae bacterium]MCW5572044.1 hypothetical protein [Steroidobacteraceae bacterium]